MQGHKRDRAPMRRQHFNAWLYPASRPDAGRPWSYPETGTLDLAVSVRGSGKTRAPFACFAYRVSGAACRAGWAGHGCGAWAGMRYRAAAMDGAPGVRYSALR